MHTPGKPSSRVDAQPGVAAPAWLAALTPLIPELKGALTAGVEAGPAGLILTGTVSTDTERERIGTKAEALFAGVLPVDNRLQVLPPKRPASLSLSLDSGAAALSGVLPGQAEVDRVRAAARTAFPGAKITDTLTVGDAVAQPAWLAPVLELMPELAPVDQAELEASAGGVTLSGTVFSAEIRERIEEKAKAILGEMVLVNRIEVAEQARPVETPAPAPPPAASPLAPAPPAAPPPEVKLPALYFQHDSIALTVESLGLVDTLFDALNARPDLRVELAGFTDSSGEEAYNRDLSRRRAEEILGTLVSKGIDPGRLVPKGYGEERPAADNGTPEGRALNRRVELRIPAASGGNSRS